MHLVCRAHAPDDKPDAGSQRLVVGVEGRSDGVGALGGLAEAQQDVDEHTRADRDATQVQLAAASTTWRYELEAVDGGTRVTESMHKQGRQIAPVRWLQAASGVHDRPRHLRAGMTTTLERLAEHSSAG